MNNLKVIEAQNKISKKEITQMIEFFYQSFLIDETKHLEAVYQQELLITLFTDILNKYLEFDLLDKSNEKLDFINLIDKFKLQKELLELQKGNTNIEDLKSAAQRLGAKSQSAFKLE